MQENVAVRERLVTSKRNGTKSGGSLSHKAQFGQEALSQPPRNDNRHSWINRVRGGVRQRWFACHQSGCVVTHHLQHSPYTLASGTTSQIKGHKCRPGKAGGAYGRLVWSRPFYRRSNVFGNASTVFSFTRNGDSCTGTKSRRHTSSERCRDAAQKPSATHPGLV